MRHLASNRIIYSLQYHVDQDPEELRVFWSMELSVDPASIRIQRKSNSNKLSARTWRSRHGVLAVGSNDTNLRARLEAWMDCLREEWLHSMGVGV